MSETATTPGLAQYLRRDAKRAATSEATIDQLRRELESAKTELSTARAELTRVNADNQKLAATADTGASQKRVKELEGELNGLKHKSVFEKAAKAKGMREDAIEAAWKLSGYKAEGEPNEETIGEAIDGMATTNAFLFGKADQAETGAKPGAGGGQGKPLKPGYKDAAIIEDDDDRWNDAAWQMTHQSEIQASTAAKEARSAAMARNASYGVAIPHPTDQQTLVQR